MGGAAIRCAGPLAIAVSLAALAAPPRVCAGDDTGPVALPGLVSSLAAWDDGSFVAISVDQDSDVYALLYSPRYDLLVPPVFLFSEIPGSDSSDGCSTWRCWHEVAAYPEGFAVLRLEIGVPDRLWLLLYDRSGAAVASPLLVRAADIRIGESRLASNPLGALLVAWTEIAPGIGELAIWGSRYVHPGSLVDAPRRLSPGTGIEIQPRIALQPRGDAVVLYNDVTTHSARAQRLSPDGPPSGDAILLNDDVHRGQPNPWGAVASSHGSFAIASGIHDIGRGFNADVITIVSPTAATVYLTDRFAIGNHAVVPFPGRSHFSMLSIGDYNDEDSLVQRTYSCAGTILSTDVLRPTDVEPCTTGSCASSLFDVAVFENQMLILWSVDEDDGTVYYVQRFQHAPGLLHADGFESGDTSAWSLAVP